MAQVHLSDFPDDILERARVLADRQGKSLGAKVYLKTWLTKAIEERVEREEKKAAK